MKLPKGLSIVSIGDIKIAKLYDTNIVEIDKLHNSIILRTGGWQTKHTKKCINLILNEYDLYLVQEEYKWNLYRNGIKVGTFQDDTLKVAI